MVRSFVYTNYIYIFAVQILTMRQTIHRRVLGRVIHLIFNFYETLILSYLIFNISFLSKQ